MLFRSTFNLVFGRRKCKITEVTHVRRDVLLDFRYSYNMINLLKYIFFGDQRGS